MMYDIIEEGDSNDEVPKSMQNGKQNFPPNCDEPSKLYSKKLLHNPCGDGFELMINYITLTIIGLLVWAFLYTLLKKEVQPPDGQLFALIALTMSSYLCGWLISFLHLPPLLGMLLCGVTARSAGLFNLTEIYTEVVASIREIALTGIIVLAGSSLDGSALKKMSFVVARLTVIPCITETVGAAIAAHFVMGMPLIWGLLLGFSMSAVSPAIVIPSIQTLKEKGYYGANKEIFTLIIAASSMDDILVCIPAFGVLLGLIFSKGDLISNIIHGPVEVAIGIAVGLGWGFILAFIPHRNENHVVLKRSVMIGGGALTFVLGSQMFNYAGAGPLAAIISTFLASLCWKRQGWSHTSNPIEQVFSKIWTILEPLLLGLIGTEINFSDIGLDFFWQALLVLGFCLIGRIIACCIVLIGVNLNFKEIIFVNLAWLSKATVQAALGPIALDLAKKNNREDIILWAQNLLTIVVLSILITAPIGAVGITIGGPRLLSKVPKPDKNAKNQNLEMALVATTA